MAPKGFTRSDAARKAGLALSWSLLALALAALPRRQSVPRPSVGPPLRVDFSGRAALPSAPPPPPAPAISGPPLRVDFSGSLALPSAPLAPGPVTIPAGPPLRQDFSASLALSAIH